MKKLLFLALFCMCLVLVGCKEETTENETVTVVDMVGDTVVVPKNPQKVAVIARAAADMLVGFGLGDKVDGVYSSILDNPWTTVMYPNAANFYSYGYEESSELFYSREVDLVLAPEKYIAEALREDGITAITVSLYGTPKYENVLYSIADLIKQIWPATETLVDEWKAELATAISNVTSVLDQEEITPRTIYYVRGDKNRGIGYTDQVGSLVETFYDEYLMMEFIGDEFDTNKPSAEAIMLQNPEVVVIGGAFQNVLIDIIKTEEPYNLLSAVINNQVFNIPIGFVMWEQNSMALPLFLYDQANKLYPDLFDFDIETLTKNNFSKYFGIELSNDQIYNMLHGLDSEGNSLVQE